MAHNLDTKEHKELRGILTIVGPTVIVIGLLFTLIGIGNFFWAFNHGGMPKYFWCGFVGLPLLGLGTAITKFAFLGAAARYMASEVAPVGKDVVNYMAEGTHEAVRDISSAIGEGLASSFGVQEEAAVVCQKCNEQNDADANYCNHCGTELTQSICCSGCNEQNDPDASFCNHCGEQLG